MHQIRCLLALTVQRRNKKTMSPFRSTAIPCLIGVLLIIGNVSGVHLSIDDATHFITVGSTGSSNISISPQTHSFDVGETREYQIILDAAPNGLSGYDMVVSLTTPGIAQITGVTYPSWALLNLPPSVPNQSVLIQAADIGKQVSAGATNVLLATLSIQGTGSGTTPIVMSRIFISADGGSNIPFSVANGQAIVDSIDIPVAGFSADKTSGAAPLTVQFTDQSTGSITSYAWDFGDGGTSSLKNPAHTYTAAGTYTVTLTVTGHGGSDSEVKTSYIRVTESTDAPVAAFTSDKTSGAAPLTVQFTDQSTGSITSYAWDFGDGGTSSLKNPAHTYTAAGTYTVNLTVTGPGGSDSEVKTSYIRVTESTDAPVAAFTANTTSGVVPQTVQFTDTSVGTIISRLWSFGDGTFVENVTEIIHTYTTPGNYTASLTVSGPDGDNTTSQMIHIFDDSSDHFFTVRLESGWNLFSIPVQLEQGHDQFSHIFPPTEQDKMMMVLGWSGSLWYTPQSTDTVMPLSAFFIRVRDGETVNATIVPSTVPSRPPLRSMTEGWNIIGPAPEYQDGGFLSKQVEASLISIDGNYSIVLSPGLNQPGWSYVPGSTSRNLLPYKGYWVYMNQVDVLAGFSTTPISL